MLLNWCDSFFIRYIFFYLGKSRLNFRLMVEINLIFLLLKFERCWSHLIDITFFGFWKICYLKITAIHLFILVNLLMFWILGNEFWCSLLKLISFYMLHFQSVLNTFMSLFIIFHFKSTEWFWTPAFSKILNVTSRFTHLIISANSCQHFFLWSRSRICYVMTVMLLTKKQIVFTF